MKHSVARFVSALVLVVALVLTPAALAGKGKPSAGSSSATLTLAPASVASGETFAGSGCGYVIGRQVNVVVTSPATQTFFPVGVDSAGCIMFRAGTGGPGQYKVETFQKLSGRKQSLMARALLSVY